MTPSGEPQRIVIAGGGTAGWMAAATLAQFLPKPQFDVALVESDAIGTVGVGEATIPQIRLFLQGLGLDEDAVLRACGGTFKLGIEFDGWQRPGSAYMHAFGNVGRDVGLLAFQHYWMRARALGMAGPLADYSLNEIAARSDRMHRGGPLTAKSIPDMPYAYHLDAGLFARTLRRFAERRGVRRTEGRIAGAALDVFEDEPNVPEALLSMDHVVTTPHIASGTHDTRRAMGELVLANLHACFAGEKMPTALV